jgi:hypothetical protein
MKHFLIVGLLAAIGAVALAGTSHAASRYCYYNPDDPDCFDQGGYDPVPPPPPPRIYQPDYGNDQYDDGYDEQYAPPPRPRPPVYQASRCERVGQSLRRYGYRNIRPLNCGGKNYKFEAFRGGGRFFVKVRASSGRIVYQIRQ